MNIFISFRIWKFSVNVSFNASCNKSNIEK